MTAVANFHIRDSVTAVALTEILRGLSALPAHASGDSGWISLYPQLGDRNEADGVFEFTRVLSGALHAPVFGFFIDREAFRFWLFDDGRALEAYSSLDPGTANPEVLIPFCRTGVTAADLAEVLREKRTQLQADVRGFLIEWQKHRDDLRAHLTKMNPPGLASQLREFDERSSQMNTDSPADPADLAADLGDLLGLLPGLARLNFESIEDGRGPLGTTRLV